MFYNNKILFAKSGDSELFIHPQMANRHGMIAGATGTGKTVTLKVLAESFSDCGVPVFLADVKGDLAGMCMPGEDKDSVRQRIDAMNLSDYGFDFSSYPVTYWDIYGEKGLPLRATISEMGPLLLSKILDLNETQSDILTVIFKIADDENLLLLDTKDLRSMVQYVSENAADYSMTYGNMSKQSLAAIIRSIVALESEGGEQFFGEPAVSLADWLCTDAGGKGTIQILDCQKLICNPSMYATFMLWMLSELFESLPEIGDRDKPKMVFFFDEAHMLFQNASKTLLTKIEQVVKLIRSKGVGIYFITQNPKDIPDGVLSQLGNKIQHALHAYTPAEQKGVKAAAQAFRENPAFDTYATLSELGIGEALISVLDENGIPTIVERGKILPPQSQMGTLDDNIRSGEIKASLLYTKYSTPYDRDSAYEVLTRKVTEQNALAARQAEELQREKEELAAQKAKEKEELAAQKAKEKEELAALKAKEKEELAAIQKKEKEQEKARLAAQKAKERAAAKRGKVVENAVKTAGSTVGRELGNSVGKSIGGSFGKKLGGNVGASLGRGILSTLFK